MDESSGIKDRVLGFVDAHPRIMLSAVLAVIVLVVIYYFYSHGYGRKAGFRGGGAGKKDHASANDELDSLIESIHAKQKRCRGQ